MKCVGCGYFNLPQAQICGRCGRDLAQPAAPAGGSLQESLYPPRARERTLAGTVRSRLRDIPRPAVPSPAVPWDLLRTEMRPWLVTSAALVPGAGHLMLRESRRGACLFGASLAAVALALISIHTVLSDLLLWGLLGLIWYSVWDAARRSFPLAGADREGRWLRDLRLAFLGAGLVAATIYGLYFVADSWYPVYSLTTDAAAPTLASGDTVVSQRLARPLSALRRGDIVVAQSGEYPIIERVLGLPGDRVQWVGGALSVNGRPVRPAGTPLSADARRAAWFAATVPPGHVCLWRMRAGRMIDGQRLDGPSGSYDMLDGADISGRAVAVVGPPAHRRRL